MNLPRFGVLNPVPVNLLTISLIVAGIFAGMTITREFFPESEPDMASVTLPYPGASPEEVEEGLGIKVEDAIAELDEVDQIRTTVSEGGGGIVVEFVSGVDIKDAVDEVERTVDSLTDLPPEAERLQTIEFEAKLPVIILTLYGDAGEAKLKRAIRQVQDDLRSLPGMGELLISGIRNYEIRVDVAYDAMLRYGISLPQISSTISAEMREVPSGTVRTEGGNIAVRTLGVEERASAIRDIILFSTEEGQTIRLSDIADVQESFEDTQLVRRFNGSPAVSITVFKTGEQDAVRIAEMVRAYAQGRRGESLGATAFKRMTNPAIVEAHELGLLRSNERVANVATHSDLARFIEGRLDLLSRNAFWGAGLVFATLLIFLNWRVALWVGVGLVTAICGTLLIMNVTGVTLNLLTMFGLIVVLGLLVDDAIVVAENVQTRHDAGEPALQAGIDGTNQVFWPVVATVLTSIVAFLPLRFVEGRIGDLLGALPMVVACALAMSLVESVLILPSHMAHSLKHRDKIRDRKKELGLVARFVSWYEGTRDTIINNRIVPGFGRLLALSIRFRYISIAIAVATLVFSAGMLTSGRVAFTFLSESDSETIIIDVRMPTGVPIEETQEVVEAIEQAALAQERSNESEVQTVASLIGERQDVDSGTRDVAATNLAQIFIELAPVEQRTRESSEIIDSIREAIAGKVASAEQISFSQVTGGPGGADITFELLGTDLTKLDAAAEDIKQALDRIPGVIDIADDNFEGQRELQISLLPGGAALGFTRENVAQQIRGALFGLEAHVFAERREDIDVRVRLDEETRENLYRIEHLWLISPLGLPVPLAEVAAIEEGTSYATIRRIDRKRAVTVTADTTADQNPEAVTRALAIDSILASHPQVILRPGGRQKNLQEAFASLPYGFAAALLMIYVILAWLFGSFLQPVAVMLAIPFGMIGVIWGHFVMGYQMTFLSLIGFVALSGIVVNDSLILVEFYNHRRHEGADLHTALLDAGRRRLRPIFLTTVTTICGLTPLMLEQSFQAKFLIPMAIAISFGLLSATVLILMVLPCILVVFDDVRNLAYFLWHGERRPSAPSPPPTDLALTTD